MNELTTVYDTHAHGREARLAPAPVQCKDFVISRRELAKGPEVEAALAHWRRRRRLSKTPVQGPPWQWPMPGTMKGMERLLGLITFSLKIVDARV